MEEDERIEKNNKACAACSHLEVRFNDTAERGGRISHRNVAYNEKKTHTHTSLCAPSCPRLSNGAQASVGRA